MPIPAFRSLLAAGTLAALLATSPASAQSDLPAVSAINGTDAKKLYEDLLAVAKKKTAQADVRYDDSGKPIVEDEELGIVEQGPGEAHPLELAL